MELTEAQIYCHPGLEPGSRNRRQHSLAFAGTYTFATASIETPVLSTDVQLPSPFNLWQNTPVEAEGAIKPNPPISKKGDYIVMRAEMDLVICRNLLKSAFGIGEDSKPPLQVTETVGAVV